MGLEETGADDGVDVESEVGAEVSFWTLGTVIGSSGISTLISNSPSRLSISSSYFLCYYFLLMD